MAGEQHHEDGDSGGLFGIFGTAIDRAKDSARYAQSKAAFDKAEAGASSSTGGGGYQMEPGAIERIAKRWYDIADKCHESLQKTVGFANITPPGLDTEGSGAFAKAGNKHGEAYRQMLAEQGKYASNEADKCRAALKTYLGNEAENEAAFRKHLGVGSSGDTGGFAHPSSSGNSGGFAHPQ